MNAVTIEVDGSAKDGVWVWWEPGRMGVVDLHFALHKAGLSHLTPKASTIPHALKEAVTRFINGAKIKKYGCPIEVEPLRQSVKGVEAKRIVRGQEQNDHVHVMSAVVTTNDEVEIVSFDPSELPFMGVANHKQLVQDQLTKTFKDLLNYYPTAMVSTCLSKCIIALGGTLCRKTGGVFFLPEDAAAKFEVLATEFDRSSEAKIITTRFALRPGDRSYELVLSSLKEEVGSMLKEIEENLNEMTGKARESGQATRRRTLDELNEKISRYESLMGVLMPDLHQAVASVREAVDYKSVMDMSA